MAGLYCAMGLYQTEIFLKGPPAAAKVILPIVDVVEYARQARATHQAWGDDTLGLRHKALLFRLPSIFLFICIGKEHNFLIMREDKSERSLYSAQSIIIISIPAVAGRWAQGSSSRFLIVLNR